MADEHNRLDSQFNVVGAFWAPETIGTVQTGTLTSNEQGITFTTAPEYTRSKPGVPLPFVLPGRTPRENLPALHGFTEDGLCTLCDLIELNHPGLTHYGLGQSVGAVAYRVSACVTGLHIGGSQDKCLESARYTFTGLSDWLPKAISEKWGTDFITLEIPFQPRDILDFCVRENHVRVKIKAFSEFKSSLADGARISKSLAYVEVEGPEAESFAWYYEIGNRLENMFSLLTGASLALETFFVYRGDESGHVNSKRNSHVKDFDPRDCAWCTPNQLANCLIVWLGESWEFRRVEALALGVLRKGKLFVETEFLSLAQALEGVHRVTAQASVADRATFREIRRKIVALLKLENVASPLAERICDSMSHVSDPTFSSRLAALCQRFTDPLLKRMEIDPPAFVKDVVGTRNFYTHTGGRPPKGQSIPSSGKALFLLSQKMRALLRGVLLLHLGVPEAQFADALDREATRYH
jgi:ApeA N-terminal domain 1